MTWSPGANEEAGTWNHLWACPAGRGSSLGREVAAAGGMGGEIFLEVAGRQALWHTPSWRFFASMQGGGGGGAQLGETRGLLGGGEKGAPTLSIFPSRERGIPGSTFLGQEKEGGVIPPLQGLPH